MSEESAQSSLIAVAAAINATAEAKAATAALRTEKEAAEATVKAKAKGDMMGKMRRIARAALAAEKRAAAAVRQAAEAAERAEREAEQAERDAAQAEASRALAEEAVGATTEASAAAKRRWEESVAMTLAAKSVLGVTMRLQGHLRGARVVLGQVADAWERWPGMEESEYAMAVS